MNRYTTTALHRERRLRINEAMKRNGWDALVVYGNPWRCDYLRYACDFPILEGHGVAVLDAQGDTTLVLESPLEAERARVEAPDCAVTAEPDFARGLAASLERRIGSRIAFAPGMVAPVGVVEALPRGFVDATPAMARLLMSKAPAELQAVERAAALADDGYCVFLEALRPGRREFEVVAEVEAFFRARGCPDNFMIIGSGGPEVRGMHPPGERALQAGDMVTTELTPCVEGYYAQLCRTAVIGEPSATQRAAFEVFAKATEAGLASVRPGARAADVARAENDVFRACGLGEYTTSAYTRVRGHGLGLYVDSAPALLEDVGTELVEGMTLIVHPNTWHPEAGYIVLGDSVVVTSAGHRCLTQTPRTLFAAWRGSQ